MASEGRFVSKYSVNFSTYSEYSELRDACVHHIVRLVIEKNSELYLGDFKIIA